MRILLSDHGLADGIRSMRREPERLRVTAVEYEPPSRAGAMCPVCGARARVYTTRRRDGWTVRYLECECGWRGKAVEGE